MTRIPKIVFQTWKSRHDMPPSYRHWRNTIIEMNPSYRYVLWDDRNNRTFIRLFYPWFLSTYDKYEHNIMRVDAVRYFFLYHFGGIYADLDTECLRPLDQHLDQADILLGRMGVDPDFFNSIPNAIMMSAPRQDFWLLVFHLLIKNADGDGRPETKTGPGIIKDACDIYRDEACHGATIDSIRYVYDHMNLDIAAIKRSAIEITHPRLFYPVDWTDPIHQYFVRRRILKDGNLLSREEARTLFPGSSLVTYWSHSWELEAWDDVAEVALPETDVPPVEAPEPTRSGGLRAMMRSISSIVEWGPQGRQRDER